MSDELNNGSSPDAAESASGKSAPASQVAEAETLRESGAQAPAPSWLQPLQLTIEQTAILTSYSVRTLKRLVATRAIPGVTRVGRCLRFNRRAVEEWLERGCPLPGRRNGRR
jgi:excisionase family DNA binding protein